MAKTKGYSDETLSVRLADRYYRTEDAVPDFLEKVEKIGMTIAHMCYQCGTCTGSCPSAPRSSYRIRKFVRRAVLGLADDALTDPDLWLCTTCYSCTDRCPRDIAPTDIIMAMRNLAFTREIVPKNFLNTVQFIYKTGHGVPNNDVNRAARVRLGLEAEPETTAKYSDFIPGIQKILDHYGLKDKADEILAEDQ